MTDVEPAAPEGGLGLRGAAAAGSLTPDQIRSVVRAHTDEIRACYELALESRRDLTGRVVTRFVIDPDGDVAEARVRSSDVGDPTLEGCIVERVLTWAFDPPLGGGTVIVNYPFLLQTE